MKSGEDIYMKPPVGIKLKGIQPGQVLKLEACLYGLKQAERRWYDTLRAILEKIGFQRSNFDHGLYH